jgi:PAS domain S-box-containing protein
MESSTRVLFVEDNKVDQLAFQRFVKGQNLAYDYVVAGSLAEAKAAYMAGDFDIILCDYLIGDGTALDLLDFIEGTPTIIITGSGDEHVAVNAMKAGAVDYLIKNPDINYLVPLPETVRNAMRHKRAEEELQEYRQNLESMVVARTAELRRANQQLLREIGERKQAEQALRHAKEHAEQNAEYLKTLIEKSPLPMIITDEKQDIEFLNDKFIQSFGYTLADVSTAEKWWQAAYPDEEYRLQVQQSWMNAIEVALKNQTDIAMQTWDLTIKDGSTRTCEFHMVPLGPKNLIVMQDVTERQQTEAALRQAQKLESVGRLAGGVAHDFNNMLGVIIGYTEMALQITEPSHPLHASLEQILNAAERSADLTRQLLAFARKQTIVPRVLNLNETVEGMLTMLRRLIGENIELVWLPAPGTCQLNIDPSQIDQILANLCVNARDAINGVGKITIETDAVTIGEAYGVAYAGVTPGDYLMLSVTDDGSGMDKETLDQVFEPFFTTKSIAEGTGLGLATVYGIVKQNNGAINVYSEPGTGTTFRIYLPRHTIEADRAHNEDAAEFAHGQGELLLLVEDEPANREVVRAMLTGLGYEVLVAATPGEAIGLAQAHNGRIDVLITDVIMPEMNGWEMVGKIQEFYPNLNVMFMSGYSANVINLVDIFDKDVNFIQKPFSIKDLATKVHSMLAEKAPGL